MAAATTATEPTGEKQTPVEQNVKENIVIIPLLIGGLVGAFLGNGYGQVKGFTAALVPVTTDPNLEAAYRRAFGTMAPGAERGLNALLRAAREEREAMARGGFVPPARGIGLPPGPQRPPPPQATGAAFGHHSLRAGPPAFYAPYGAGALFTSHGYRPGPTSFYPPPYASGGGISRRTATGRALPASTAERRARPSLRAAAAARRDWSSRRRH